MSTITTFAPSWANSSDIARPIPDPPPVTMATFPSSSGKRLSAGFQTLGITSVSAFGREASSFERKRA
jgi:hypothetical protein